MNTTPITGLSADDAVLIDVALTHLLDGGLFGREVEAARDLRARIAALLPKVAPIIVRARAAKQVRR